MDDGCDCKIGRVTGARGLPHLDEDLRRRHEEGASLRNLAVFANARVLGGALEDADADVAGDAESVLATLRGDDPGRAAELETRLEQAGVDVDALRGDFVSHQTVATHLRDCRDVDTSRAASTDPEDARNLVAWARRRDVDLVDRTLARLRDADELRTGDLDVTLTVRVTCEDCGRTYRVDDLLDRGACDCEDRPSEHGR